MLRRPRQPSLVSTIALIAAIGLGLVATAQAGQTHADRRPFAHPNTPRRYARDRVVDVRHVALNVSLDFDTETIAGSSTLDLSPINAGLQSLTLDAAEMTIDGVRLLKPELADPVTWRHDGSDLHLTLPQPLDSGQLFSIVVDYHARPRRGLYFVKPDGAYPDKPLQAWTQGEDEDSQFWFPCYDYPNDRATLELRVSVPKPLKALSNGALTWQGDDPAHPEERSIFHWKLGIPQVTYLATLVVGDFAVVSESWDGIPVEYWVQKGQEDDARRSLGKTPSMMEFFSRYTGLRYPYEKYAQVCVADFLWGGMENTTATTLTDTTLHDARAHLDFSSDGLVAHELAHQWFGDLLTCRDWAHAWLNEGFATYFETLWREDAQGRDEALYDLRGTASWYLGEDAEYRRPIVTRHYDQSIDMFDGHLYGKGALVLHALRAELGDTLFRKAISHYVASRQQQVVETRDLVRAIEEATGRDLQWFFDQWVFSTGFPELDVAMTWDADQGMARVDVKQTQKAVNGTPEVFRLKVTLAFGDGEDGFTEKTVTLNSRESTYYLALDHAPDFFRFDANHDILARRAKVTKTNALWIAQLSRDPDVLGRVEAAEKIATLGTDAALAALRQGLTSDSFWGVRIACAAALGKLGSDPARDTLLACLSSDAELTSHPKVRRAVVAALGEFEDDASVSGALAAKLQAGAASYFVEAECARSLGKVGGEAAWDTLVTALATESWRDTVRTGVIDGLASHEDPRAVAIFVEHTQRGRSAAERRAAISALGQLGRLLPAGPLPEGEATRTSVREHLEAILADPEYRVRRQAVRALETLGDPAATAALEDVARNDVDGRLRTEAKDAAGSLTDARPFHQERRKLRHDLDRTREEAKELRKRLDAMEQLLEKRKGEQKRSPEQAEDSH